MPLVPRTGAASDADRKKIRKGKYIDLKKLLPTPRGEPSHKKLTLRDGQLAEVEEASHLKLYEWWDAFIIYMSIRLEFFPGEAQGLLRHMQIVKTVQAQGKDGPEYDVLFRRLKEQQPDLKWGEYLTELVAEIRQEKRPSRPRKPLWLGRQQSSQGAHRTTTKPCFGFNSSKGCKRQGCRYGHFCSNCSSQEHPRHRCGRPSPPAARV
jgi:hypothetical protein